MTSLGVYDVFAANSAACKVAIPKKHTFVCWLELMTDTPDTNRTFGLPPSLDDVVAMAQRALDGLPPPFCDLARSVSVRVSDFADEETLEALRIDNPYDLTGLYSGVAMTLETLSAPSLLPPAVWLYRLPILDEWAAEGDVLLEDLVAHVLVHELGHYFGWSDEDMDRVLGERD